MWKSIEKLELQDADISEEHGKQFEELCEEYHDIFSKDSGDLGRTPLVIMDIDTKTLQFTLKTCRLGTKRISYFGKGWELSLEVFLLGQALLL